MEHHNKHIHPGKSSSIFFTAEQILNILSIKEGDNILDAGCGDGFISIAASKLVGESGKVFAFDIDADSIDKLKKEIGKNNIKNIIAAKTDISKKIPLKENKIDICLMVNVFHGLVVNDEYEKSLKEIKRVAKVNGIFAIIEIKKVDSNFGPPMSVRLSPGQVESILKVYGFSRQNYFEIGPYHYGILFSNS